MHPGAVSPKAARGSGSGSQPRSHFAARMGNAQVPGNLRHTVFVISPCSSLVLTGTSTPRLNSFQVRMDNVPSQWGWSPCSLEPREVRVEQCRHLLAEPASPLLTRIHSASSIRETLASYLYLYRGWGLVDSLEGRLSSGSLWPSTHVPSFQHA